MARELSAVATRARRAALTVEVVAPPDFPTKGLASWLAKVAPRRAAGMVTVGVVSDRRIARLNLEFRGQAGPTDVLSFPGGVPELLGDIVVARGVATRQARRAGHALPTEFRILVLHGLLHLLGYDHEDDDGQMARLERRLRRKGGLVEGLIERAAPGRASTFVRRRRR